MRIHRITSANFTVQDVKVMWVAAGPSACHSVIGDAEGRCWTWGRNEVQLPSKHKHVKCRAQHVCPENFPSQGWNFLERMIY